MGKKFYSSEEISKHLETVPSEIQDMLYGFEMTSAITKVGEKYGLHIDQMDALNTETGYVMLGLTDIKDFPSVVSETLGVDPAKAGEIAHELEVQWFAKIREAMQKPSPGPDTPKEKEERVTRPATSATITVLAGDMHPADILLTEKTVVSSPQAAPKPQIPETMSAPKPAIPNVEPPKPQDYKADPYREPTN